MPRCTALFLVGLVLTSLPGADAPRLTDSGLPAGPTEQVLPGGAAAHLRINNLGRTLRTVDELVLTFIPERFLPADLQAILDQPHPLLHHLGSQAVGAPLDDAVIAQLTGLASDRAMNLTLYPSPHGVDWVAVLPTNDHATITGFLVNILRPRQFTATTIHEREAWIIEGGNPDLPRRLVIITSADHVYCCSSEAMASMLGGGQGNLAMDPLFSALPPEADTALMLSTLPFKPLIRMGVQQVTRAYPDMVEGLRHQVVHGMPPDQIAGLNLQLRMYTGLSGINEAFAYGDALAGAAVDVLVPAWARTLGGFDGCAIGLSLRPDGIAFTTTVQGKGFEHSNAALPMADIRAAVAAIPDEPVWFTAEGKRAAPSTERLTADWLDRVVQRLTAAGITNPFFSALASHSRTCETVPELIDSVPWLLTAANAAPLVLPEDAGLEAWLLALEKNGIPRPELLIFPQQDPAVVAQRFADRAAIENRNAASWTATLTGSIGDSRYFDRTARFVHQPRPGKSDRLVYENAWISRHGLFGYSQHEWINRTIADATVRGPFHLLQRVDGDGPSWLDDEPPAARTIPDASGTLLDRVTANADQIAVMRTLPALSNFIDLVASLERTCRRECDAYIERMVAVVNAHVGDEDGLNAALIAEPIPVMVQSLNIDLATRTLYLQFPGGLRYPRPEITPVLRDLFADFLAKHHTMGGLVAWRTAGPQRLTVHVDQDLGGIAWLVKSTGNRLWSQFFAAGNPLEQVGAALGHPDDGQSKPEETLVFNTLWPIPQ